MIKVYEMRKIFNILIICFTLFISSNLYAMTLEIQKSEILNEEVLKDDYSSIKYGIKSEDGKIYYMFILADSKEVYDKNVIKDKKGNLKIMNIGTDIIIDKGNVQSLNNPTYNLLIRIAFGLLVLITIFICYFGKKYLVKHEI